MNLSQALRVGIVALMSNKLRSALTILGMAIGIGAVITLMGGSKG